MLNYVDYKKSKSKKKIKETYQNSFPKEERFPFWILKHSIKKEKNFLFEVSDNDKFVGICFLVNCQDSFYLMYLAVEERMRNKQYGCKILKDLKEKFGTIFLSIEKCKDEISAKRKNFYLRNGYFEKNIFYEDNGVVYELLCTDKDYIITEEILKKRYGNMSDSKTIKYIMGKIFNMDNTNFIN